MKDTVSKEAMEMDLATAKLDVSEELMGEVSGGSLRDLVRRRYPVNQDDYPPPPDNGPHITESGPAAPQPAAPQPAAPNNTQNNNNNSGNQQNAVNGNNHMGGGMSASGK